MKYTIKCERMSVSLFCARLSDLRITVHKGRRHTNVLADELDRYPWCDVSGTAFSRAGSSIHFSAKGCRRRDVADTVAHCMERVFSDLDMNIEIRKVSPRGG